MTSEEWQRIKQVMGDALDQPDTRSRLEFLSAACDGDQAFRSEIDTLLTQANDRLDIAADQLAAVASDGGATAVGQRFGDYELIRELGRGGMGTIYLARRADEEFEKEVAIKVLKRGTDTDEVLRRFRAERQILAQLEHPNIARLIDAGTSPEGLPYFVMEYVDGIPITDFCDAAKLGIRERIELFLKVCGALHFAHQNLVVHRDLKPGNILITAASEPKLLDFGIAKLLSPGGDFLQTTIQNEQRFTPAYASPEQVRGDPVTTASDVYSLGALLYHLLTGEPSHRFSNQLPSPTELFKVIVEQEPTRASAAAAGNRRSNPPQADRNRKSLQGDLDNILGKALQKEPGKRYSSVTAFADDLRRHLQGMPVRARSDTVAYRASKFITRHKLGVAGAVSVLIFLLAAIVFTTAQRQRAERLRNRAEAGEEANRRLLYAAEMALAYQAWEAGNVQRVLQLLESQRPQSGQSDLRSVEWALLWHLTHDNSKILRGPGGALLGVAFSPDGSRVAAVAKDGSAHLWDTASGQLQRSVNHVAVPGRISFTSDGRFIAAPSANGAVLFSTETGEVVSRLAGHSGAATDVEISPNGRVLGTASVDGTGKLWDLATGQPLFILTGHSDFVTLIRFSPDGQTVVTTSRDRTVRIWDVATGRQVGVLEGHSWWVIAAAFSPDGKILASAGSDGDIKLWDLTRQAEVNTIHGSGVTINALEFSHDGKLLFIADNDTMLHVREARTGKLVETLRGHTHTLRFLALVPGIGLLASSSDDGTVRLWNLKDRGGASTSEGHSDWAWSIAYSPDGRLLASGSKDGTIKLWDVKTREPLRTLPNGSWVNSLSFSRDGGLLATASDDGLVRLWNCATGELVAALPGHADVVECVAFSPLSGLLVSGGKAGELIFWDSASKRELARFSTNDSNIIWDLKFSPDGKSLAVSEFVKDAWEKTASHFVKVWDVESRRVVAKLGGHVANVRSLAFSPDGKTLATGGEDRTIRLWDTANYQETAVLKTHYVVCLDFSNDGRRLISGGIDRTLKIWDFATGSELGSLNLPAEPTAVAFSPKDTLLAVSGKDNKVHQWQTWIPQ